MNDDDDVDEPLPPDDDEGSDTDIPFQGDRDTHNADGRRNRAPLPFKEGQLCGEFQLEKLLGRGSSGAVFRALDIVSRRSCALKILVSNDEQELRRDRTGFRRMTGLRHPNLVRVDELHRVGDHVALSMEEVHGETLRKSKRRLRRLDPHIVFSKLLSITRDYASALSALHCNGLIHRDIKPSNLMIDRNDVGRVIDYGLVGTYDAELDSQCYRDYIAGTLRYIAPEAYFDQRYTPAGDIFSLGLVLLEVMHYILGRYKWKRDKEDKSQDGLLISSAVNELHSDIPEVLRDGCLEMLQLNAGDRPTAAQVARLGLPAGKHTIYLGGRPLFGRDKEFGEVCDWLSTIYDGGQGRIHIHGDSGIGKTELVDAVERHLKSMRWGQVFRARCRPRDSHPMQAMDQFADQIASRYASSDRHRLLVDPVSAEILHQAFPVFKSVVKKSMRLPAAPTGHDRMDALQAAVNLSVQLRKVGPLIFIVDDAQWADIDSNAVLDSLQTAEGGMLGIITVSRLAETNQTLPASKRILLKPLPLEIGLRMLNEAALRWSVSISNQQVLELAEAAAGNPFRLSELADEFRPGGFLNSHQSSLNQSLANIGDLDRLCQHRVARLSDEARLLLPLIATADCAVSIDQLEMLTGLGRVIEIAISELVNQRLVMDDVTGGLCISLIHDRVCEGVVAKLGPAECRNANLAWARVLKREIDTDQVRRDAAVTQTVDLDKEASVDREPMINKLAGRVARHLIDAGQSDESMPYAKLAAIQCERTYAFSEAAEWYTKVASLQPQSCDEPLREAARLFVAGDKPVRAADCYRQLAGLPDTDAQMRRAYEMESTRLLIQSGRLSESRELLGQLAAQLGLPRIDTMVPWLSVATRNLRIARGEFFQARQTNPIVQKKVAAPADSVRRIDFARSIIRPLFFFNAPYAAELYSIVAKHTQQHGTAEQQIQLAITSATFACCDCGARRTRGEQLLRDVQAGAVDADRQMAGDYWVAKALTHAFAVDWRSVADCTTTAVDCYRNHTQPVLSKASQSQWLSLWADWHLGQWDNLPSRRDNLMEDAKRRDDRLTHFMASSGIAASAWLIDDDLQSLDRVQEINDENFRDASEISQLFRDISRIMRFVYAGDFENALDRWKAFERMVQKSHLSRMQVARVLSQQYGALIALHIGAVANGVARDADSVFQAIGIDWVAIARQQIGKLRDERLPFTIATASLFDGILASLGGELDASRKNLVVAQQLAKEHQLLPVQLAAKDHLHYLESQQWQGFLCHHMQSSNVNEPERLEKLYTVAILNRSR
jgi:serine/threonine protein kinase